MKKWIAKYQKAIVGVGAVSVLVLCYLQQKEMGKLRGELKVKTELSDSLYMEDFNKSTIIGRYELTLDNLKERNPKEAKKFEDWMSHNTE